MDVSDFKLENFRFSAERIMTDKVKDFFKEHEFYSLVPEEKAEKQSWKDTKLSVKIIADDEDLQSLEKSLVFVEKLVLDTETTSLNVQEAQLVGVSIFLDEKNIYYINRMHRGPQVSDESLKTFLRNLLDSEKTLIAHNLKYDLEIIETFLKS